MRIRQIRAGVEVDEGGAVPNVYRDRDGVAYLTTTVFVKYNYEEIAERQNQLESMSITCLPNGMLQDRYNPNPETTFWMAGRNAPTRGEGFRVRIGLPRLKALANWRVQHIQLEPDVAFSWDD